MEINNNSAVISIKEYDELRKIKKAVEDGDIISFTINYYPHFSDKVYTFYTKEEAIAQAQKYHEELEKELKKVKEEKNSEIYKLNKKFKSGFSVLKKHMLDNKYSSSYKEFTIDEILKLTPREFRKLKNGTLKIN